MNCLFLFPMHAREEKVALSPDNCSLNLFFHGLYYIYNNNQNTSTTPSTKFRAYFPPKAIFQIQDWPKTTGSVSSQASRKSIQHSQLLRNPKPKKGNLHSAHYGFIMEVSAQLWSGSSQGSWSDESQQMREHALFQKTDHTINFNNA